MRTKVQARIATVAGEWGVVPFPMNDLLKPLAWGGGGSTTTTGAYGLNEAQLHSSHRLLPMTDKLGSPTDFVKTQPYGYDQLWGRYNQYKVLQSSVTIQMAPADPQAASRIMAGFTTGLYMNGGGGTGGGTNPTDMVQPTFAQKYVNVARPNVIALDAYKMIPKPSLVTTGGNGSSLGLGTTNTFKKTYFHNQALAIFKRHAGTGRYHTDNFLGSQAAAPQYKPMVYFCAADLGAADSTLLHCNITIMHKVRLIIDNEVIPPVSEF